jgi:dihydrofolate reductase
MMAESEPVICFTLARAENGVIGKSGGLPWRLPDDFAHFKQITIGKPVIMGRTTLTSDLKKALPGRPNIVVTRDPAFKFEGARVAHSLDEAFALARAEAEKIGASEIHVIGGAEIFRAALPRARRIYLTEVHGRPEGDVKLEAFDSKAWKEVSRERHEADERHALAFSFVTLERR